MVAHAALPRPDPSAPTVPIQACPIATTLGSLGRKWTLTILREIAFYPGCGFSAILKANRGLRQRTLSLRLRQLVADGIVRKNPDATGGRHARYELTDRGLQVWPILAALFQYGVQNFPDQVFEDGRARNLEEVYPQDATVMLGHLGEIARRGPLPAPPSASGPRAVGTPRRGENAATRRSSAGRSRGRL